MHRALEYAHRESDAYPADLFPALSVIDGPNYLLPTAPGLGVDFDEAAVAAHPFEHWDAPKWYRRDGQYTNW